MEWLKKFKLEPLTLEEEELIKKYDDMEEKYDKRFPNTFDVFFHRNYFKGKLLRTREEEYEAFKWCLENDTPLREPFPPTPPDCDI